MCHIGSWSRAKICVNERHGVNIKWMMIGSAWVIAAAIDIEPMKVPIAILYRLKGSWNWELGVAPVANWHSRQPEIMYQLMRQPPKALPMGSGLFTIWRETCSPPFQRNRRYSQRSGKHNSLPQQRITVSLPTKKTRNFYTSAERDKVTKGTNR